eukprot:m.316790 g.316790  ORF g.316790 m.316790 type:complete len:144 (+) comp27549_c0_seq2:1235-1666(+)
MGTTTGTGAGCVGVGGAAGGRGRGADAEAFGAGAGRFGRVFRGRDRRDVTFEGGIDGPPVAHAATGADGVRAGDVSESPQLSFTLTFLFRVPRRAAGSVGATTVGAAAGSPVPGLGAAVAAAAGPPSSSAMTRATRGPWHRGL